MAISCSPDDLQAAARCLKCLDPGTLRKARARLLAVYAGGSTDPQVLAEASSQFRGLGQGTLQAIITLLMARTVYPVYYSGGSGSDSYIIPGDPIITTHSEVLGDLDYQYQLAVQRVGSANRLIIPWPRLITAGVGTSIWEVGTTVNGVGLFIQRSPTHVNMPIDENNAFYTHAAATPTAQTGWTTIHSLGATTTPETTWLTGSGMDTPINDPAWNDDPTKKAAVYVNQASTDATFVERQPYAYRVIAIADFDGVRYEVDWNTVTIIPSQPLSDCDPANPGAKVCRSGSTNTIMWSPPASIPG